MPYLLPNGINMNSLHFLLLLVTLHLTGLVIMAGTTIIDYITYRTFWRIYALEKQTSKNLLQLMSKFSRLIGIGAAVLILTGFGMMVLTKGAFGQQLWFRIKFALVIILVLNGILVGRRQGSKLRKRAADTGFQLTPQTSKLKSRLNLFYCVQLLIFIVILILSVFKFN